MSIVHICLRRIAVCALALVLAAGATYAAAPLAPVDVAAKGYVANGLRDGDAVRVYAIDFFWKPNPRGDAADGFRIYKWADGDADWSLLATTRDLRLRITDEQLPMEGRDYYFYVTAFNGDGESAPERKLHVSFRERDDERQRDDRAPLRFLSVPPEKVQVGSRYIYDADVAAADGADVVYDLSTTAPGATIDRKTGVVSWTPTATGVYRFTVQAGLRSNPSVSVVQPWVLHVVGRQSDGDGGMDLAFITRPLTEARVGTVYTYDADVRRTAESEVRFLLRHAPDGAVVDAETGVLTWTPSAEGEYKFYLTAVAADGAVQSSQTWAVRVGGDVRGGGRTLPVILFTAKPGERATAGELYTYDADVRWDGDGAVRFEFEDAPAGAVLDENTGVLIWTPTEEGMYRFHLRARAENTLARSVAVLGWVVHVKGTGDGAEDGLVTTVVEPAAALRASAYPNPAVSGLTLTFDGTGAPASVVIVDADGAPVYRTSMPTVQGSTTVTIDISSFASGRYYARIEAGGRVQVVPLTVVR